MAGYLFFGYWREDSCSRKPMSLIAVVSNTKNVEKIIDEFTNFGEVRGGRRGNTGNLNYRIHGLLTKERYIPFAEIKKIADKYNIMAVNAEKYAQNIPTTHTSDFDLVLLEILLQYIMDKK